MSRNWAIEEESSKPSIHDLESKISRPSENAVPEDQFIGKKGLNHPGAQNSNPKPKRPGAEDSGKNFKPPATTQQSDFEDGNQTERIEKKVADTVPEISRNKDVRMQMPSERDFLHKQVEKLEQEIHTYELREANLVDFMTIALDADIKTASSQLERCDLKRHPDTTEDRFETLSNYIAQLVGKVQSQEQALSCRNKDLAVIEASIKKLAKEKVELLERIRIQNQEIGRLHEGITKKQAEIEEYRQKSIEKDAEIARVQAYSAEKDAELARVQANSTEKDVELARVKALVPILRAEVVAKEIAFNSIADFAIPELRNQTRLETGQSGEEKMSKGFEYLCRLAASLSKTSVPVPIEMMDRLKYLYEQLSELEAILTKPQEREKTLNQLITETQEENERMRILLSQYEERNESNVRLQEQATQLIAEQESLWSEEMIALTSAFGEEFPFTTTKSASLKAFLKTSILRTRETIQYLSMFQDLPSSISTIYAASKRFKTKHTRGHQRNPSTGSTDLSIVDKLSRIETNLGATNLITSAEHTPYRRTLRHDAEMSPLTPDPVQDNIQRDHERVELLNTIEELKAELADEQERLNDATHVLIEISEIKEHLEHKTKVQEEKSKHVESVVNELKVKVDGIGKLRHEEHDVLPSDDEIWQLSEVSSSINVLIQEMHQPNQDLFRPKLREIILSFFYRQLSNHFLRWKSNVGLSPYAQEAVYKDDVLKGWKLALVRNNPILKAISAADSQSEKPMFPFMVLKLANEILLRKAEAEIEEGNKDSLPVFTLEYLTEKYGSRVSAVKMIRQMVPALWAFDDNRYTGQLYARLFQVKNPLSDNLVSYLTRMNHHLLKLVVSRLEQKREEHHSPLEKKDEFVRVDPESGGIIYLSDALDLLYSLPLMSDYDVCRRAIDYLRDETMDKSDYVAFILMHKMNELKLDSKQFFASLDTASSGVLITDLVNTIKMTLNLNVSDKKLEEAFGSLDEEDTGKVTQEAFCRMVSQELYMMNSRNDAFSVDRNYFLYILSYIYDQTVCQHIKIAMEVYGYFVSEDLQETFQQSLQAIDSTLSPEKLQQLLTLATTLDPKNPFSRENFLCVLAAKEMNGLFLQPFGTLYLVLETVLEESPKKRRRAEFMSQAVDKAVLNYHRRIKNYSITSSCKLP